MALLGAQNAGILPSSVPVTGFADLVRQDGNAESKMTARVRWSKGDWSASVSGIRYNDFIQTSLTLNDGNEWTVDEMQVFNLAVDRKFKFNEVDARVRIGVRNFTDQRAPLADRFFGYYADQHNDFGRSYYLDVQVDI